MTAAALVPDPTPACKRTFTRYIPPNGTETLVCTFRFGHDNHCSWRWAEREAAELKEAAEAAARAEAAAAKVSRGVGSTLDVLLTNIVSGGCDDELEAILAAAHGRKRARRGVADPYGVPGGRRG